MFAVYKWGQELKALKVPDDSNVNYINRAVGHGNWFGSNKKTEAEAIEQAKAAGFKG